ncbi:MAG: mevalonate kinase [Acidimicrobiales bacterium]
MGTAPARVGLLGHPSDGFGGRSLALAIPRFQAEVTLEPIRGGVEIVPGPADGTSWPSLDDLAEQVDRYGYGSGAQLLAATVRTFVDVARSIEHPIPGGVRLSYRTTIPRQVGLGGSSALAVATLRALNAHYAMAVPDPVLATLALRVETEQLGLAADLQDRVVQTYGGLVAMDFGPMENDARFGTAHGRYEPEDPGLLPPLFLAYRPDAAGSSSWYHRRLRSRYDAGDPETRALLHQLAGLAVEGRAALRWRNHARFGELLAEGMELTAALGPLPDRQVELVDVAAELDLPAGFAGSGGAVVGAYREPDQLDRLEPRYRRIGAEVVAITPYPV